MSILHTVTAALAGCNLHLCLYGAFGAHLLHRAAVALRERRYDAAREHGVYGLVHVLMGML